MKVFLWDCEALTDFKLDNLPSCRGTGKKRKISWKGKLPHFCLVPLSGLPRGAHWVKGGWPAEGSVLLLPPQSHHILSNSLSKPEINAWNGNSYDW